MNKQKLVQNLMDHIQAGDFKQARTLLTDDFQFSGPIPAPINAEQWLEMSRNLRVAFPDLRYNFNILGVDGDTVNATSQLRGTHTGSFDLTLMDMGVIPATNKEFSVNIENSRIIVRDDKIASWIVEPTEGAGVTAILEQLEVHVPA